MVILLLFVVGILSFGGGMAVGMGNVNSKSKHRKN